MEISLDSLEAESFGQQLGDMRLLGPARALKKNRCVGPEFVDHLPARAAGRASDAVIIGHRDRLNLNLGSKFRHGRKDSGALRAIRHAVRCVLNIAARENFPVREQNRRAHVKVRIGRMSVFHDSDRRPLKPSPYLWRDCRLTHRESPLLLCDEDGREIRRHCKPSPPSSQLFLQHHLQRAQVRLAAIACRTIPVKKCPCEGHGQRETPCR